MLSFDIRNLALGGSAAREKFLVGLENTIAEQLAFRGGIKFLDFSSQPGYSFGIGLLSSNLYHTLQYKLNTNNYLINYALVVDSYNDQKYFVHSFSITVHL